MKKQSLTIILFLLSYYSYSQQIGKLKGVNLNLDNLTPLPDYATIYTVKRDESKVETPLSVKSNLNPSKNKPTFQQVITGKVIDKNGVGLPGVTILLKGTTTTATSSDANGSYNIAVSDGQNATLIFTFIGYVTKEVPVNNQTVINVSLVEDAQALNEVVVVGYGTQEKKDLTGAIGTASGEALENNAVTSVGQALQGKIAGVNIIQNSGSPGAGTDIRVRGWGTFGANTNPLVVVDGIITNYGLNDLNPNDIEQVSILKDASSAAIYGSRGANGVVLVTTKRGKAGKPNIQFSGYYSIDKVINPVDVVDATEYAQMNNEYYTNAGSPAPYSNPESYGKGTNWQDEIFRTGSKQDYALSVSGGSEKNLYAVSMGYYKGEGTVVNSLYDRTTLRINNDMNLFTGLKIGTSIGLSYGTYNHGNEQEAIDRALIYAPTVKPYNEDGTYGIADQPGQPTTMSQPLVAAYERDFKDVNLRALINTYAEYEIIKGLKFRTSIGIEYYNFDQTNFTPSYNYGLGNSNNTATLSRNTYNNKNWMSDNILTYKTTINQVHDLDMLVGYTFQDSRYENLNGYKEGFIRNSESQQVLDAGTTNMSTSGNYNIWTMQSYLGRLNYSYKHKYLLTSNIRIDQSSRFAKDNRTGVFPSFSAGWVLSEESFIKDILGPVSFLKLRTGYGVLGNQDIGVYPYQSVINASLYYPFGSGIATGAASTALANPDIRWEKSTTTGAGLELNFFNNKLRTVVDYYNRLTSDILVQVPLPAIVGANGFPYQNAASVRNTGYEFTIQYGDQSKTKDFAYNFGFNMSINNNEVTKLNENSEIIYYDAKVAEGHQINEFFGYIHDGIFQTKQEIDAAPTQPNAAPGDIKFKDLNGDGVINSEDRTFIGSNMAKYVFGFSGNVQYKNFDFSLSMNSDLGRDRAIDAPGFAITRGAEQTNAMYYDRWTGPGTSNWVPRIVGGDPNNNSRFSTFWLRSQNYLRIKNVQLGYDLSKMVKSANISKLRVYVSAQNLFTFTSFPGYDPEVYANTYPLPRSIYLGFNIGL